MPQKLITTAEISRCILEGDKEKARSLAEDSLRSGFAPLEAVEPFIQAIRQAGDLFEQGDFFLPQLLLSAAAMQAALQVLFPDSSADLSKNQMSQGTVIAGTVQGDIHEIGKNLVCALLSAHGFRVIDLGGDVSADKFLDEIIRQNADLLVLSALLTTTMLNQKYTIKKLEEAGCRNAVKVMVGGAPVTAEWARSIGADGYAPDAARAVDQAFHLLGKDRA